MADWRDRLNLKKEALKDLEEALVALKKKINPVNPKLFEAMSEPYLKDIKKIKSEMDTMTIDDYIDFIAEENYPGKKCGIEGFMIGRGKKIYWYITPMPRSGRYRCLPIDENGKLGWPRYVYPGQMVKVVRKS